MAWGSGTKAFEATYKCYSVAAAGRDDLENGDKILLPEKAFREVSRLRLQFPLTMMARNARKSGPPSQSSLSRGGRTGRSGAAARGSKSKKSSGQDPFIQYCGVLEFSSPDGVCHLPHWMMESLNVKEGGRVALRSAKPLPKGDFAKFQPHKEEFLDFAMALGVRNVLELAMQHYSALAVGQTVLIQYGNDKYMLDVVEVSPGSAISLYGTVDLKVEFAPVAGSAAALAAAAELAAANKENSLDDSPDSPPASSSTPRGTPRGTPRSTARGTPRTTPRGTARSSRVSKQRGGPKTPADKSQSKHRARPRPGAGSQRSTRSSPITPRGSKHKPTDGKTRGGRQKEQKEQVVHNNNGRASSTAPSPTSTAAIQAMAQSRKAKLSKFSKRGSLRAAASTAPNNVVGNAAPATSPVQPQMLGRSLASGATVRHTSSSSSSSSSTSSSSSSSSSNGNTTGNGQPDQKEEKKTATWGTGYTLNNSKKVHSNEPIAAPPAVPTDSNTTTPPNDDTQEPKAFEGKGATLGGGSGGGGGGGATTEKPWVAAARARHARHAKKKAEDQRLQDEKDAQTRAETEAKCQAIAAAAAAAMSEEEKKEIARKAKLEAARLAMENQIEDKLLRDAEMKRKKEEKRNRIKRERLDKEATMEQQVEDLEALALAHAVQQSVESQNQTLRDRKQRRGSDVEDAMMNAAMLESAQSNRGGGGGGGGGTFDSLLQSASNEVREQPRVPVNQRNQKRMTPPDQNKRNAVGKGRSSGAGGLLNKYEKQLGLLREMGFANAIEASTALEASGGDVQRAVELLTGTFVDALLWLLWLVVVVFVVVVWRGTHRVAFLCRCIPHVYRWKSSESGGFGHQCCTPPSGKNIDHGPPTQFNTRHRGSPTSRSPNNHQTCRATEAA